MNNKKIDTGWLCPRCGTINGPIAYTCQGFCTPKNKQEFCDDSPEDKDEREKEIVRLKTAIEWALGQHGDFTTRPKGAPLYWWRTELRKRAGL